MKWIKKSLLGLLVVVLLAVGVVYLWSAMLINRGYPAESHNILLSSRPDVIARGERLAQVFGCFHGCHGADMEGMVLFESWYAGRIVAPNLTRALDEFSPGELEAIIRQGVRPDGTSIFGMPSTAFATMTDRDLSAILSFIASHADQQPDLGRSRYGPLARWLMIKGDIKAEAGLARQRPWQAGFERAPLKLGEYLAMNACSECHGLDLDGGNQFAPPLDVAKSYSLEDFLKLLETGVGAGDSDLGLMTQVSKFRFSAFTVDEVEALHSYLNSR